MLLLIGAAHGVMLLAGLFFMSMILYYLSVDDFLHMVRRMRWLFLSIFIIYAFATPGEMIPYFSVSFSPTFEGVNLGLQQVEKLLLALAALSLLVTRTSNEHMMLGIYRLLKPLGLIGLNIERFSARLMLTLQYVEALAAQDKSGFSFSRLDDIDGLINVAHENSVITIHDPGFSVSDKVIMFFISAAFLLLIYRGFA